MYKPDPSKPRNYYYSLKAWEIEQIYDDELAMGIEPKLKVLVEGGRWDHILALNTIWRRSTANPPDESCATFHKWAAKETIRPQDCSLYRNMNSEVILVTGDNIVLITRRPPNSLFSHGCWSASFEEQFLRLKDDGSEQSDAEDLFACVARGAREEFGVEVIPEATKLLSFGVEWGNFTAAFLFLARCRETYEQVLRVWPTTIEQNEAVAIAPLPIADIEAALANPKWQPSANAKRRGHFDGDPKRTAPWHITSRARLLALAAHLDSVN
jgi:hypothetical protein